MTDKKFTIKTEMNRRERLIELFRNGVPCDIASVEAEEVCDGCIMIYTFYDYNQPYALTREEVKPVEVKDWPEARREMSKIYRKFLQIFKDYAEKNENI